MIWVLVNAVALAAATWLLDGITLTASTPGRRAATLVVVALIFGVVNAIVRPLVRLISLPLILITLGLMLLLTSWVSGQAGLGFHVAGFWTAVLGALVVTVATWILELLLHSER